MIKKANIYFFLFCSLISFQGCLKDNVSPEAPGLNSNAEVITYLVNKNVHEVFEKSLAVNVDEVYSNIANYLLVDIREHNEFVTGHIENAKNVQEKDLLSFIKNININEYSKIVIISSTGHNAAYAATLLQILGFYNIFYLDYGMGYWNPIYSEPWLKGKGTYNLRKYFSGLEFKSENFYPIPQFQYSNPEASVPEKIADRVSLLLNKGYNSSTINFNDLIKLHYDFLLKRFTCYIPSFGPDFLYKGPENRGHPNGSVYYKPSYDFKGTSKLQTIHSDKLVVIHSLNGQDGACLLAYLHLLGYDAKNLSFGGWGIYGANYYFWKYIVTTDYKTGQRIDKIEYSQNEFSPYGYWTNDNKNIGLNIIRNYPSVTGE